MNYSKILSLAKEVKQVPITEAEETARLLQSGNWIAIGAVWTYGVLELVLIRVQ